MIQSYGITVTECGKYFSKSQPASLTKNNLCFIGQIYFRVTDEM